MKLTSILLLVTALQVAAGTSAQQVTYSGRSVRLQKVFNVIKQQTGFLFFYDSKALKDSKPVSVEFKGTPLRTALEELLSGLPFEFQIQGNTISITRKDPVKDRKSDRDSAALSPEALIPITGVVRDSTGAPLAGASVAIKGKGNALLRGVTTNEAGAFSIEAKQEDVLVISFVGYEKQEIRIRDVSHLVIVLMPVNAEINQVVVTALGIKKSAKSLTYNVQEVKGEEVTRVPDASFVNALTGKVAGVTINASASGIGGSTRVIMRGLKSFFGNNNALYVLDGIPLPNLFAAASNYDNNGKYYGRQQTGDGISSINPEDIESIDVLTGASSAALYGSQAANGVILINTKSGLKNTTHINFSNSTNFYNPFVMPKFQNTYGASVPGTFDNWSMTKLGVPSNYDPEDYFQTGTSVSNSISLATGSDNSQTYLSAAANNSRGIIPENTFNRYNVTLHQSNRFLDNKLKLDLNLMYIKSKNENAISQGVYNNPIVPLYLFPRSDNIEKYQAYERYDATRNFNLQYWPQNYQFGQNNVENPFWTENREPFMADKERYMLGAGLTYQALSWLDLEGRVRVDNNSLKTTGKLYASSNTAFTNSSLNGFYNIGNDDTRQVYADFLAKTRNRFNDFILNGVAGASLINTRDDVTSTHGGIGTVANLFTLNNIVGAIPDESGYYDQGQALFGSAELSYKNKLFINATGRNEWSSALASTNTKSFFYPSAGFSAVISDMVGLPRNIISYLKIRGSYSEVGNAPPRFVTQVSYPVTTAGVQLNPNLPLTTLKPERTHSFELGINSKFLNNHISLDVTLYNTNTFNQFFTLKANTSSGIGNYYVNAGQVNNKGIEAVLGGNLYVGGISWNPALVFTLNRNKVVSVIDNKVNPIDGSIINTTVFPLGSPAPQLQVGKAMGEMYVTGVALDPKGYYIIDQSAGTGPNEKLIMDPNIFIDAGNTSPRYNLSFRNGFAYKGFGVNFLIDYRNGGVVQSYTQSVLDYTGTSVASAQARDNGGVKVNGATFDTKVYYTAIGNGNAMAFYVYSATNVRLREASISYTIPGARLKKVFNNISVSFVGRNLFMFYNKAPFDPEITASTGTYYQGVDAFMLPSLRSFGFGIKAGL